MPLLEARADGEASVKKMITFPDRSKGKCCEHFGLVGHFRPSRTIDCGQRKKVTTTTKKKEKKKIVAVGVCLASSLLPFFFGTCNIIIWITKLSNYVLVNNCL